MSRYAAWPCVPQSSASSIQRPKPLPQQMFRLSDHASAVCRRGSGVSDMRHDASNGLCRCGMPSIAPQSWLSPEEASSEQVEAQEHDLPTELCKFEN